MNNAGTSADITSEMQKRVMKDIGGSYHILR